MTINSNAYSLKFDPIDQEIYFSGNLRVRNVEELSKVFSFLETIHDSTEGVIRLNSVG